MKKSDITEALADMIELRNRIEQLERAQGDRKTYQYSEETEAVRWRAVCLSRTLRGLTGGDE